LRQAIPTERFHRRDRVSPKGAAPELTRIAEVVTVDTEIMHGTPCFAGTRVPVQTLLDYIEDGDTLDSFLSDFITVDREQAVAFLKLAKG
jgi:uncharacterized protein (DUF433 family)